MNNYLQRYRTACSSFNGDEAKFEKEMKELFTEALENGDRRIAMELQDRQKGDLSMSNQGFWGAIGFICLIITFGIVGGIEQGAPLGNFVDAFVSLIFSGVAFSKGGLME